MQKTEIHGVVVVITGATSGIGFATALAFAARGAHLVLIARNESALAIVADECRAVGAVTRTLKADVTDPEAVQNAARLAVDLEGRIDIWVNNAGVGVVGQFTETPLAAHRRVIETNLVGYMNGAHAVLPYFQQQLRGVLINVNSIGGWVPAPYAVSYSASKFGLRGFSEALRGELRRSPGIQICDIFPAFIDTPAFGHAGNYAGGELKPVPPVYDPRRVAAAIVKVAQSPRRFTYVGASTYLARAWYMLAPATYLAAAERVARRHFAKARRVPPTDGNLFAPPPDEPQVLGNHRRASAPRLSTLFVGAAIMTAAAAIYARSRNR